MEKEWDENRKVLQYQLPDLPGIIPPGHLYVLLEGLVLKCMMDTPRHPISELHLGKIPDSMDVQCWKVNFKTEVCANTPCPTLTMSWIKEVETATSIDDLMTSQSIEGRRDFPDFEMLDAKIASALKKIISSVRLRRRVSVEEQRAQKSDHLMSATRVLQNTRKEHFRKPCNKNDAPSEKHGIGEKCL